VTAGKPTGRARHALERVARAAKQTDGRPTMVEAAKWARQLLPGDSEYGDPLSTARGTPPQALARRLSELSAERPSALREMGLSALQVYQAVSEAQGRGRGKQDVTILFTDLVDFSSWALEAGDTSSLELLRTVGSALEPPIEEHHGRVVKRLGDGLMAVFPDPPQAVGAALEAMGALEEVEVDGHRPRLRAGIHLGRPRKIGDDYIGVDVNIAARVAEAASGSEVLISDRAAAQLDESALKLQRKRRFKAKGAPSELEVYSVEPRDGR
jgi:adenylate cyclase